MNAAASLSSVVFTGADAPGDPVVFINGIPAPSVRVANVAAEGPLDRRRATLVAPTRGDLPADGRVTVAQAIDLGDGSIRWPVLIDGRVESVRQATSDRATRYEASVLDRAADGFDARIAWAWRREGGRTVRVASGGEVMRAGSRGNRSLERVPIAGEKVRVVEENGGAWTVREAIETLLAFASVAGAAAMRVDTAGIPAAVADAAISRSIRLDMPVGDSLAALLDEHGLVLTREMSRSGRDIATLAAIVPAGVSRVHTFSNDAGRSPALSSTRVHGATGGAERLTAEARGWLIESTFAVVAAWNPALQGLDDAEYSTDAPGFAAVSDVFRLWALNEDGAFTPAPFSRGPAFDLRAFFGSAAEPSRARFLPCVTTDGSGRAIDPIIEASTNGGATWFVWPGTGAVRDDRAAVWLADPVLPDSWCAAARAGEARVRVTGSLRSAAPVRRTRLRGNAFHGESAAVTFGVGEAFEFARVSPGSRHFDGVRDGSLRANERDDSAALERWITARAGERRAGDGGRGEAVLLGAWPMLRPGDRVVLRVLGADAGGPSGDEGETPFGGSRVAIVSAACEWPATESRRGPSTRLVIAW